MLEIEVKKREKPLNIRFAIIIAASLLLVGLSFYIGQLYACQDSYLYEGRCVEPEKIGVIEVCEYNSITCLKKCVDVIPEDIEALNKTFNIK